MVCGKCQLNTSNAKEVAKCSLCCVEFHATCCRIRTVAKLPKMSAKALSSGAVTSVTLMLLQTVTIFVIMDLLKNIKQEMSDSRKSNSESLASLEKNMMSVREFLKKEIDELRQRSRCNNIEIRGVSVTRREDIYAVVESIAKAIGVVFNRGGISIVHRFPAPRDRRFHPSIVVQFVSRSIRVEWHARKNRIETTDSASTGVHQ
ncbi:hypothetical protein J6590_009094 [Homalodisca vitripennis]|nr:hypothetical protein J6590_009094 [Homalodisca vitripennis]